MYLQFRQNFKTQAQCTKIFTSYFQRINGMLLRRDLINALALWIEFLMLRDPTTDKVQDAGTRIMEFKWRWAGYISKRGKVERLLIGGRALAIEASDA